MASEHTYCAGLPHSYAMAMVVFCPHERSWRVHLDVRLEAGDDDGPEVLSSDQIALGPFDMLEDADAWLRARLRAALETCVAATEG